MIKKKISLEERSMFVKRKLIEKEINKDSAWGISKYGAVGALLGYGTIGTMAIILGADYQSELFEPNVVNSTLAGLGTLMGILKGFTDFKITRDYYDDGLCDDGNIDSKVYDKNLYSKAIRQEEELFNRKGYIISKSDLNKKSDGVVYDNGMKASYHTNGVGRDKRIMFRTEKIKKTLQSLENIKLEK